MSWVEIAGACMAVAAILAGLVGVVVSIRETNAERASTYPPGSTERDALTGKENPLHAMVQS